MVLAELAGRVTHRFKDSGDGRCFVRNAERRASLTNGGQPSTDRQLACDEVCATRCTTRLGVVVGETHALRGQLIQVRRSSGHDALIVDTDVGPTDVVAHDQHDVGPVVVARLLACCHHHGGKRNQQTEPSPSAIAHGVFLEANCLRWAGQISPRDASRRYAARCVNCSGEAALPGFSLPRQHGKATDAALRKF